MNQFEDRIHTERREQGELALDRIGELWAQSQEELLGDAVEVTEGYRSWWSYVHHFVSVPGYVYAYAYGQLLALAVYGRYEEEGDGVRARLPRAAARRRLALARGARRRSSASTSPTPGFWDSGLALVERQLDAAEQARARRGPALAGRPAADSLQRPPER